MRENDNRMKNELEKLPFERGKLFIVENYLEAVGIMTSLKAGVNPSAVRQPLAYTKVSCESIELGNNSKSSASNRSHDSSVG